MWRERLTAQVTPDLPRQVVEMHSAESGTLIPADKDWPIALDDLGDRAPYLLGTRGATSFLTTTLSDRVTITGSHASTSYGEHVTHELAAGMADEERIVVSGGAVRIVARMRFRVVLIIAVDGDISVVAFRAAGHRDVEALPRGPGSDDNVRGLRGHTLSPMRRDRVAQFGFLAHILRGQHENFSVGLVAATLPAHGESVLSIAKRFGAHRVTVWEHTRPSE